MRKQKLEVYGDVHMLDEAKKMKVLHVLGSLNRGGAETWLMHVLRHIDRDRFQLDFLVHTEKKCAYDDEARALGAHIIPNPDPKNPFRYALNFIRNYRKYGPYDVVHSHVHHYSGFVLFLARICGVPKRIAHSHADRSPAELTAGLLRRIYLKVMQKFIMIFATDGLACSKKAAESLFGQDWEADKRLQVLYYGIDLSSFDERRSIKEIKKCLGLPENSFVIGHVARFHPQKNHSFLVDIAEEVFKRMPNSYLLLVGDGPLRSEIEAKVKAKGMEDRVIFAGVRDDVPRLMQAMDVFVMPSLYEGLGLVLVEAQASGIPCVISDVIPEEADINKDLIFRVNLYEPLEIWAKKILETEPLSKNIENNECLTKVADSQFNIEICVKRIEEIYESCANSR